jgi:PAS domain-containing protein
VFSMELTANPALGIRHLPTAQERDGGSATSANKHCYAQQQTRLHPSATADGIVSTSEDTYHLIVDAIQDYAIFMLDVDGYVLTWNNGAHRLRRYNADEIIGQHYSVFYLQEDLQTRKPQRTLELARN